MAIAVVEGGRGPISETVVRRLRPSGTDLQRALEYLISFILGGCTRLVEQGERLPLSRNYRDRWRGVGEELTEMFPGNAILGFMFCHCLGKAADVEYWLRPTGG